jgi:hypothetical protein
MPMKHPIETRYDRSESRIRAACAGLVYVSETDAPVEFFAGRIKDIGEKQKRVSRDLTEFFDRYSRPMKRTAEQAVMADRFIKLRDILNEELSGLRLTRIGRVRIDIYITGKDQTGKTLGVKTRAVET